MWLLRRRLGGSERDVQRKEHAAALGAVLGVKLEVAALVETRHSRRPVELSAEASRTLEKVLTIA